MAESLGTPSKQSEAAQFRIIDTSESVPAYGDHIADDLYSENIPNYGTGLPSLNDPDLELDPVLNEEVTEDISDNASDARPCTPLPPPPSSGPLSLTLDKALIFPNTVPATALYSLNYTLNSMGNSITLRRSVPGPLRPNSQAGKIQDKDLYDITRPPFSAFFYQIHGKRQSTYPGVGDLKLKMGLRGKYWECRFKDKVVLKGRGGVWEDADGKVVAREINEVLSKRKKGKEKMIDDGVRENPGVDFEPDVADLLVDLMVACWCAKTWCNETHESRQPSRSDGSSTRALYE